jgi:hypothetical protein
MSGLAEKVVLVKLFIAFSIGVSFGVIILEPLLEWMFRQ